MNNSSSYNFKKPNSVDNIVLNFNKNLQSKKLLIVDQQNGPYKKIQDALNNSIENSRILIESGIYRENLLIQKDNIFLEPKRKDSEVYILGLNGPTIIIDIKDKGSVNIQGINISNNGYKKIKYLYQNRLKKINNLHKNLLTVVEYISEIKSDHEKENLILLNRGILFLTNCKFNMNLYLKISGGLNCSIYTKSETKLVIDECCFEGSKIYESYGIICNNSDISLKNSKFKHFQCCGLLLNLSKQNLCSIYLTKFLLNNYGIMAFGENLKSKITDCHLEKNNFGIFVSLSNDILLNKNKFVNNKIGVSILNADSNLIDNIFEHNENFGIYVKSDNNMISKCIIKNNIIRFNYYGIKCTGFRNHTNIKNNKIYYNRQCGILTTKSCHILICKNSIYNNLTEGIGIKDSSSAFVQQNKIYDNLKANIAIGGYSEKETTILKNEIHDGRCEGIFLLRCYKTFIFMNNIFNNCNGILCINSNPVCFGNKIYKNKAHGFQSLKESSAVLRENEIYENMKVGLYFRDTFGGEVVENEIFNNVVDLVLEAKTGYPEDLIVTNNFKGEKRYSKLSWCSIF